MESANERARARSASPTASEAEGSVVLCTCTIAGSMRGERLLKLAVGTLVGFLGADVKERAAERDGEAPLRTAAFGGRGAE
mmetsp:Transcript_25603/g.72051  ORF Transcript_25603/g.72051 Transcript_25603/m.72051 type:complete len:81 (-) Transcript_25603:1881-2123(-)|eukprot:scaffold104738_cov33-Tisochrysis_lutea.AAC.6